MIGRSERADHADRTRWLLLALVLVSIPYAPLLAGRVLHQRDLNMWQFPARWLLGRALGAGEIPVWNPYQGLGFSIWADPLYGAAYPPNWLHAVAAGPRAVNLLLLLHLELGALGMFLLAARFGARPAASAVAALAFALGGFATSMWTFGILLLPLAWFPWTALGFVALADDVGTRRRIGAGPAVRAAFSAAAPILTGEVFLALLAVGLGLSVGLVRALDRAGGWREIRPRAARLATAGALAAAGGVLLGAVVLLPAIRAAGATERASALPEASVEVGSFHPARLLELGAPNMTRRIFEADPGLVLEAQGGVQPLATSVYAGASVLALALLALRRGRRTPTAIAFLAAFGLLLALGGNTPIYGAVRAVARPLSYMRYPEKFLAAVACLTSLLAALGAERLLGTAAGDRLPARRAAILAAAIAAAGAAASLLLPVHVRAIPVSAALLGAVPAGAIAAIAWVVNARRARADWLIVAAVACDLGALGLYQLRWAEARAVSAVPPAAEAIARDHAALAVLAPPRVYRSPRIDLLAGAPGTNDGFRWWKTLRDNSANLHGIATLPGYDAALPPALGRVLNRGGLGALRLLGVEYALLADDGPAHGPARMGLDRLAEPHPRVGLYRVRDPLPRVYLTGAVDRLTDDQALGLLFRAEVASGARAVVPADSAPAADLGALTDPSPAGRCTLGAFGLAHVEARCEASRPALAVFVEQHAEGWSVTVDGLPATILRANLLARAVPIRAGVHEIRMTFVPPGLGTGTLLSLATLVALGAWVVRDRRRARPDLT